MDNSTEGPSASGVLFWRAVRYGAVLFAGYLFGMAAGGLSGGNGPRWWILLILGAVALFLAFRQGKKSQSHAAADAISSAYASARAAAVNSNQITVAGGHVVQGPNTQEVGSDIWDDLDAVEPAGAGAGDWHGWEFLADVDGQRLYRQYETGEIRDGKRLPEPVRREISRRSL